MKKFAIFMMLGLLLAACSNEEAEPEQKEASKDTLAVKPAKLSEREETIISHLGSGFERFFTIEGKIPEGEGLKTTIYVIEDGSEPEERFSSFTGEEGEEIYKKDLFSFHLGEMEEQTSVSVGTRGVRAGGAIQLPDSLTGYSFTGIEQVFNMEKGVSYYPAYMIAGKEDMLRVPGIEDARQMPEAVKEADYAIVFQLEWTDDETYEPSGT
ncbi:hypothetical protein GLW04_02920 [Halobacillus litoralis]|uniref:DUF4352 domain-containing protein n=1 Tax=Halobacillus litoralis TaxID=45668 RepID=A0A845DQJ5_9BACI|nr:hypothetical protein [Halobacillus litoralis]MYL18825.1 hypothetical protein [Halobacillus litoralis]